uniref:Uncharacterized protein n=1 Tax=Eucampia antarctica TaxID=49252 RepID=A0A7S2S619_9STRA|mmetsp:Transcript_3516/g.3332  ORF Transcript_3516/g.3332 Transcript_3516/m.3332 type:complete len:269 (+) Transcript_3516:40-846(+)|eukprot:CAMPEP_0197824776 /NCGR_PEP_ID=MMETSP1437-20131217/1989_1 /TAXON_ID=49252 ORGANISM="Eucampia antarctica, Strain CCMP1452" /NCGR_SAMPLE_ID=MMETSP1437 /ASSEMBLY_ACC=CAM_ASM_001096 /LENGTH=268 /DNA_ID=CAMNT_0043424535 /DNA_START=39 /DNA_END=845 /DNA_ORIENTATION=+
MEDRTNNTHLVKGNEYTEDKTIYDISISSPESINLCETVGGVATAAEAPKSEDEDVDALLSSLSSPVLDDGTSLPALHDPRSDAFEKLKQSSSTLGTAISVVSTDVNNHYQISEKAHELGHKVRDVDNRLLLSQSVINASETFGSWWSTNVGPVVEAATVQVQEKVDPSIKATAATVSEKVPPETGAGVISALQNIGSSIKMFDDEHQVSAMAMDKLADGVDWVAKSVIPIGRENADLDELTADGAQNEIELKEELKDESLPTSPQNK